ncbi:MAG: class I SAM-dependent methyltransferase [Pseudomonadota bacterium]
MNTPLPHGLYGLPPRDVVEAPDGALQVSPLVPGSASLEGLAEGSLAGATLLAPPGTVERRYVIALALRALVPGGRLTVAAPKDRGGSRLRGELEAFGCAVLEEARRHHRICRVARPAEPAGLDDAIARGAARFSAELGLWTQSGVFSWDRIDPGSALLLRHLPPLAGRGADFGCGVGVLAKAVLTNAAVGSLALIDIDRRAVEAARRNIDDPRATFHWSDVREAGIEAGSLDFVVMNPPFHDGGTEDRQLGQTFIREAGRVLRKGGVLWLVANRHLPYEAVLNESFKAVTPRGDQGGFKLYEARR